MMGSDTAPVYLMCAHDLPTSSVMKTLEASGYSGTEMQLSPRKVAPEDFQGAIAATPGAPCGALDRGRCC